MLDIYLAGNNKISSNKKESLGKKYSFNNLALDDYDYSLWFEESDEEPLPLEGDEEIKEGKILKFKQTNKETSSVMSTNKNWKFKQTKTEIRQMLDLLYHHNRITKQLYSNLIKTF